jgi:uncharacterized Zn finger protein
MNYIECPKCFDKTKDKKLIKKRINHKTEIWLMCYDCLHEWQECSLHETISVEKNKHLICF